jgi:NADPH-dependent ferric siderophore reductase
MPDQDTPIEVIQHQLAFRLLQVVRATRITPQMMRVTLGGDALAGFRSDAADDGSRLYFPADVTDTAWAPTVDGSTLVFPEDHPAPPGREFTPRRYNPEAGELDFEFVVHGDGPASTWATNAAPGHYLGVSGPRRSRVVTGAVDGYVLAGDDTGLPSIARRLEELPAGTPVVAVIEVANAASEQQLATQADLELHWVHRDVANGDLSGLITNTLRELKFPSGNIFAWASGEASSIRTVRRHLLNERNIPAGWMRMTGYWKRAIANYDHHLPLD